VSGAVTDDLDCCHGTLVRHADGTVECTDVACVALGADRHELVLVCVAVGCSCESADD
jgi:hypothetical protein